MNALIALAAASFLCADEKSIAHQQLCEIDVAECQSSKSTQPFTFCLADRGYERADSDLNSQWQATLESMVRRKQASLSVSALRREQRAWIKSRDAFCERESTTFTAGAQAGRGLLQCLTRLTEERTAHLRSIVR